MKKLDFGKKKKPAQTKLTFQKLRPEQVEEAKEKAKPKPTATILNFFKKVDQDVLFISEDTKTIKALNDQQTETIEDDVEDDLRFNESDSPVKRRKLSSQPEPQTQGEDMPLPKLDFSITETVPIPTESSLRSSPSRGGSRIGGFVMDSDSDGDNDETTLTLSVDHKPELRPSGPSSVKSFIPEEDPLLQELMRRPRSPPPTLKAEPKNEDFFDDDDDDDDDDLFIGEDAIAIAEEEYEAMLAIQEQNRKEAAEDGVGLPEMDDFYCRPLDEKPTCPICNGSLEFASTDEATRHVNSCLDGRPTPLPTRPKASPSASPSSLTKIVPMFKSGASLASKAAVPRPGQQLPFGASNPPTANSAFSELMSGRAEQTAWSEAAEQAQSSKGKRAHTRTCPFYKIMPGFSICVDAFRYGAVQGCKAYFLSHFHSDHYIGLSSSWCHGPIYCSKVTGTLMKKQLRVAAKWIIELEWDVCIEIPGTDGATVTMIPANHCPGSSLFLFEKTVGNGPSARKQRILHCGDFRACTAQVTHPLLRPETIDAISGKSQQQNIDICYLDTTYLDPRYAFPPQQDVISASAALCAELSADPDVPCEVWDRLQKGTKGKRVNKSKKPEASLSKFFGGASSAPAPITRKTQSALPGATDKKLLVICGTYSIGKERICVAIAQKLRTKIFAPARKLAICKMLNDPELTALLTSNPNEAQVHLQALGEIRPDVIDEYRRTYSSRFSRVVAFRPSGWTYRPPAVASDGSSAPSANAQPGQVATGVLMHGAYWRARFGKDDITAARGGTKTALCLGVPYSEHSSFRELALFVMSLNIERVVPTVNVGSDASRKKMKAWTDRWIAERKRGGLVVALEGDEEKRKDMVLWDGKVKGGGVWW